MPEPGTGVYQRARLLARMCPRPAWVLGSQCRLWSRAKVQGRGLGLGAQVDAVAWVSGAARAPAPGAPGGEDAGLRGGGFRCPAQGSGHRARRPRPEQRADLGQAAFLTFPQRPPAAPCPAYRSPLAPWPVPRGGRGEGGGGRAAAARRGRSRPRRRRGARSGRGMERARRARERSPAAPEP